MSSHSAAQTIPQESISTSPVFAGVKAHYDKYRAHAINLHLLADQCPDDLEQQEGFDRQQNDSVKGQLNVLSELRGHTPTSVEDAQLMLSLWREEVLQGEKNNKLSNTDQIASRLFEFFETQIVKG